MGVYDEYEGIQIKAGDCEMKSYKVGGETNLPDGVYIGYEGIVVIVDGVFVKSFLYLFDKWGGVIEPDTVINPYNPITQVIKKIAKKKGGKIAHVKAKRKHRI